MKILTALSNMKFDAIKLNGKVRSTMSHVVGVIIDKDVESQEVEIEWSLHENQTNRVRMHVSKLRSVVAVI